MAFVYLYCIGLRGAILVCVERRKVRGERREALAGVTGAVIELYDTDGSVGAAKGAGIGAGIYKDNNEAFESLERIAVIEPEDTMMYQECYGKWKSQLEKILNN